MTQTDKGMMMVMKTGSTVDNDLDSADKVYADDFPNNLVLT